MAGANNAYNLTGPTPGLGFNPKPQSNVMSGMTYQPQVPNPFQGAGQPATITDKIAPPTPTPQGAPMPTNFSSGGNNLGLGSSSYGLGTNTGLGAFASTTSTNGKGGTTTKPTPNPSVLAQQQALNKLGAGLVEDGLAGPATKAAIAKYGTSGTSTGGTTPPAPQTPVGQIAGQIQTSANAANDPNSRISGAYQNLQNLQNQYATQEKAIQGSPIPLEFQQGRGQVLANQFGTQEQAAQTGISNALAGQQQQIAGLGTAGGLVAPQQVGLTSGIFQPATNTYSQPAGAAGGANGAAGGGAVTTQLSQGADVQTLSGIQTQAQALGQNLSNLITSAGINPTNPTVLTSFVNGVNQWIQNQKGDPQYQNFANLISEVASKYSNILNQSGGTPTDVSQTTHAILNGLASGQSIQQVLGSLDKNATDSINALRTASQNNAVNNPSGGSTNNDIYNF